MDLEGGEMGEGKPATGAQKGLDGADGLDAAAGAKGGAVEGGSGAGEVKLACEGPILEQGVEEAGVEDVSGTGGVPDGDLEGGGVEEARTVPGEYAFFAERGGGDTMAEAAVHGLESGDKGRRAGEPLGQVAADDGVVREGKQIVEAGVKFVEVGEDGDTGLARPGRRLSGGGSVIAVEVKQASAGDPLAAQLGGMKILTGVATPEDGALGVLVQEDDALAAVTGGDGEPVRLDAKAVEFGAMERGGGIVAELANVARGESPGGAGSDGGGNLATGKRGEVGELDLGAGHGKTRQSDDGVGGIESDADDIDGGIEIAVLRKIRRLSWKGRLQEDSLTSGGRRCAERCGLREDYPRFSGVSCMWREKTLSTTFSTSARKKLGCCAGMVTCAFVPSAPAIWLQR